MLWCSFLHNNDLIPFYMRLGCVIKKWFYLSFLYPSVSIKNPFLPVFKTTQKQIETYKSHMPSLNPQKPKTWASNRFFLLLFFCFNIKNCFVVLFFLFRDQNANDCGLTKKWFYEEKKKNLFNLMFMLMWL